MRDPSQLCCAFSWLGHFLKTGSSSAWIDFFVVNICWGLVMWICWTFYVLIEGLIKTAGSHSWCCLCGWNWGMWCQQRWLKGLILSFSSTNVWSIFLPSCQNCTIYIEHTLTATMLDVSGKRSHLGQFYKKMSNYHNDSTRRRSAAHSREWRPGSSLLD